MENGDDIHFPNDAALAAWQLLARTPFADQAMAVGHRRIRLLFAGFSQTVTEIIIQLLRASAFEGLDPVRIDIFCEDRRSTAERIVSRATNLRHMLDGHEADKHQPLAWAGRIHLHEERSVDLIHNPALSDALATDGPFTAIVIAGDDQTANVRTALSLRPWTARHPVFAAPIYIQADRSEGSSEFYIRYDGIRPKPAAGLLAMIRGSKDEAEVIEPFGTPEDLHSPGSLLAEREMLAKRVHEAYRRRRREALARQGSTERTDLPDWNNLDDTYRQANRRAVDLIPALRLAAGLPNWWDRNAGLPRGLVDDPRSLERLSRMTHKSWRADRELDGWLPAAVRDSDRRLHTDLVDYDDLSEEKKELDREQIRLLADFQPKQEA